MTCPASWTDGLSDTSDLKLLVDQCTAGGSGCVIDDTLKTGCSVESESWVVPGYFDPATAITLAANPVYCIYLGSKYAKPETTNAWKTAADKCVVATACADITWGSDAKLPNMPESEFAAICPKLFFASTLVDGVVTKTPCVQDGTACIAGTEVKTSCVFEVPQLGFLEASIACHDLESADTETECRINVVASSDGFTCEEVAKKTDYKPEDIDLGDISSEQDVLCALYGVAYGGALTDYANAWKAKGTTCEVVESCTEIDFTDAAAKSSSSAIDDTKIKGICEDIGHAGAEENVTCEHVADAKACSSAKNSIFAASFVILASLVF